MTVSLSSLNDASLDKPRRFQMRREQFESFYTNVFAVDSRKEGCTAGAGQRFDIARAVTH